MATVGSEACREKVSILFETVQISATKFIQHRNTHQIPSSATQSAPPSSQQPPKTKLSIFGLHLPLSSEMCTRDHSEGDPRCWVLSLKLSTFIALSVLTAVGTLFLPEAGARADLGISATQVGCGTDSPDPAWPSLPSLRSPCL